jgi:hypothetical protein
MNNRYSINSFVDEEKTLNERNSIKRGNNNLENAHNE